MLGVLENIFDFQGRTCHEIVFVFDASFVDTGVYAQPVIQFNESGWDGHAEWLDFQTPLSAPLYPDGLEQLLRSGATPRYGLSKA